MIPKKIFKVIFIGIAKILSSILLEVEIIVIVDKEQNEIIKEQFSPKISTINISEIIID